MDVRDRLIEKNCTTCSPIEMWLGPQNCKSHISRKFTHISVIVHT